MQEQTEPKKRGFAALTPEQRISIARKGGLSVSQNKLHMAEIGRKGGETSRSNRKTIV